MTHTEEINALKTESLIHTERLDELDEKTEEHTLKINEMQDDMNSLVITGTYTGNDTEQTIDLGKTPKVVIISYKGTMNVANHDAGESIYGGIIHQDAPLIYNNATLAEIVTNGFKVIRSYASAGNPNIINVKYDYIALFL